MCVCYAHYCCYSSFHCLQFAWKPSRRSLLFSEAHVHTACRCRLWLTLCFDRFRRRKKKSESCSGSTTVICSGYRWSRFHSWLGASEMLEVQLPRQPVNDGYFSKLPVAPTATLHLHPLFVPLCSDCQVKRVRPAGTMAVVITQFTTLKSCLPACLPACMSPPHYPTPPLIPLLGCWKWLPDSPRCRLPAESRAKRVGRWLSSEIPLQDDGD